MRQLVGWVELGIPVVEGEMEGRVELGWFTELQQEQEGAPR